MTYICVDYADSMAGCGLEHAGVAWEQPGAVALRCFNLLCAQTAQHELGVSGVSSDQFRTLKHKLILVLSSNSLWQEAFWHRQPAAAGSKIFVWLWHCFCFSSDRREQNTSKTQMRPIVLNIYGFFPSVTHLISPQCVQAAAQKDGDMARLIGVNQLGAKPTFHLKQTEVSDLSSRHIS